MKTSKTDVGALLISGVILVAISQSLEGSTEPLMQFARGVCIGLSIVASLIGLYLYGRQRTSG